jgi:hypothetical protein
VFKPCSDRGEEANTQLSEAPYLWVKGSAASVYCQGVPVQLQQSGKQCLLLLPQLLALLFLVLA